MTDSTISNLTAATDLVSALIPISQSSATKKADIALFDSRTTSLIEGEFADRMPVYTPQMYDAPANGTDDDATAVQAALSAIITAGRGELFFPAGTYYLSDRFSSITNTTAINIVVRGAGIGATKIILGPNAKGFMALVNTGANNISAVVSDMEIRLQGRAETPGTLTDKISTSSGSAVYTIAHTGHGRAVNDAVRLYASRTVTITGATAANPCVITAAGHGLYTGDRVYISGIVGMTELNSEWYVVTRLGTDTFSLDGINSTSYTAYTSGGTGTTCCIGGTEINGEYRVNTVPDANSYTITAHFDGTAMPNADATVTNGGGTLTYTYPKKGKLAAGAIATTINEPVIVISHTAHGLVKGDHVWFPWESGLTVGGIAIKGGFTVVDVGDTNDADTANKYRIRYEGGNATSTATSGSAIDYTYTTHSVIKINGRPGFGTSSPATKVFVRDVYIDSDTGGDYYAHEYIDVFGTARPLIERCFVEGVELSGTLGTMSVGRGAFNAHVLFDLYECYGPKLYNCQGQNAYWGFLSGDNGGNGESTTVRFSVFDSVFKAGRRETRGTEPGFAFDYSHINYQAAGLELASVKRINIRDCPIYNTGTVAENPWVTATTDIHLDADSYDLQVSRCTFDFSEDIPRTCIKCDSEAANGRELIITDNKFGATTETAIKITEFGNYVIAARNTFGSAVTTRLSLGGVSILSGEYDTVKDGALTSDNAVFPGVVHAGAVSLNRSVTNLHLYSQSFSSGWTATTDTAIADAAGVTAPDGSTGVGEFKCSNTNNSAKRCYPSANITTSSGTDYTYSISVKTISTWRYVLLSLSSSTAVSSSSGRAIFDLQTGAFYAPSALHASMWKEQNGWWRLSLTSTGNTITTMRPKVILVESITAGAADTATGITNDGVYIWGAQLLAVTAGENHAIGPYVPTTAASATAPGYFRIAGAFKASADGMGYLSGAGGAVTQATDKSTGVTLDKVTGEITMNGAILNAATAVSFTLTNSKIAATDLLVVNHAAGGTAGAYTVTAACGAGSAVITVRNVTAGNLSEAIVLRFALVKGATS